MLTALANAGLAGQTITLFQSMELEGLCPRGVSFVSLLTACSQLGGLWRVCHYLRSMQQDYGILPGQEHYCCVVDSFGRAGHLECAWDVLDAMPFQAETQIWVAFANACKIHHDTKRWQSAANEMDPNRGSSYVLMRNHLLHVSRL
ncbi:hypothetical protein SELMODRAFT_136301 [Selaginella moellendorffii]|uniref:Pentacotripeptide-repeat region of PRORP domain-containing protein n=1 Tax=Selaginella moellendorffii TaxID=88036 RepID=D8TBL5_SELML|nr:hypothetical protein SELMODRAFT_136301 [Selaginella moellendorffii]